MQEWHEAILRGNSKIINNYRKLDLFSIGDEKSVIMLDFHDSTQLYNAQAFSLLILSWENLNALSASIVHREHSSSALCSVKNVASQQRWHT